MIMFTGWDPPSNIAMFAQPLIYFAQITGCSPDFSHTHASLKLGGDVTNTSKQGIGLDVSSMTIEYSN